MRDWTIEKTGEDTWKVQLAVDSTVIESLKWIWFADVHLETESLETKMVVSAARQTQFGMPEGDSTGSHTTSPHYTLGFSTSRNDFKSTMDLWQKECKTISTTLDSSVVHRRQERERQQSLDLEREQNRDQVRDFLNELAKPVDPS